MKIACLEEIAYQKGYITREQLLNLAEPMMKNEYGKYLAFTAEYSDKKRKTLPISVSSANMLNPETV